MKINFEKNSPLFIGVIFFILIPLFAVCYWILPQDWFVYSTAENSLSTFLNALYFSTITLTTLGYGDIYPINGWAKILVILESLSGIVFIGLFLNAIAYKKTQIDSNLEKQKTREAYTNNEKIKLCRQFVVLQPYLSNYIKYSTIVSTPFDRRSQPLKFNPNFDFHDLCDLYKSTLLLSDDFNRSAISFFFQALHGLENRIEDTLRSVDFSLWPDLEKLLTSVIKKFRQYDYESSILGVQNLKSEGGTRCATYMSELIKNWKKEIDFYESNSINYYVALYLLIKETVPELQQFQQEVINISKTNE